MIESIGIILLLGAVLVLVPAAFLFVQLTASASRRDPAAAPTPAPAETGAGRLAVVMPAHDEALGIAAAIAAVRADLAPGDRLLVVADNCSDDTAAIARRAGAEVTERTDLQRRGKGYALDHGVRWLEREPPDVVVIVDADCLVAPHALGQLARRCLATGRPVQALYLMHAPRAAKLGQRIAEFAWLVKNKLRPLGGARFAWPCQLMGTGMAFPWALIRQAPLATGHLVEDMQLGLDLAAAGRPPLFCPEALVTSVFPSDAKGAQAQRTRWEHGHLSMIASAGPRLLGAAFARRDPRLVAMALDLMVPPLAALAMGLVLCAAVDAAWWAYAADARPLALATSAVVLFAAGVLGAWARDGRALVSGEEMLALPLYVAAKLPVYVKLFTKRQVEWVRTKRDDGSH